MNKKTCRKVRFAGYKMIAFMVGVWLICSSIHGQKIAPADSIAILQKLQTKASSIATLQSTFKQEKNIAFLIDPIISTVAFYFKNPEQIPWEYKQPYQYVVVMSGSKIAIDDAGKKQHFDMQNNLVFKEINAVLIATIKGDIGNQDRFDVNINQTNNQYILNLVPKVPEVKSVLSSIELYLSQKSYLVEQVKMIEPNNDFTLLHFNEQQLNAPLPANIFELR